MFGIGFGELIVISIVVLLVFGPERLPEIASKLGKISGELKRTSDSFRREFYNSVYTPTSEYDALKREMKNLIVTTEIKTPTDCPQEPTIKEVTATEPQDTPTDQELPSHDSTERKD